MRSIVSILITLISVSALGQSRSPSAIINKSTMKAIKSNYADSDGRVKLKFKIVYGKAPVEEKKEYLEKIIHKAANNLSQYVNIDFTFVESSQKADIKFDVYSNLPSEYHDGVMPRGGHGAWYSNERRIMVSLPIDSNPANLYMVVIHEMGHMLGMDHEHHHPSREFTFDREFTKKQCQKHSDPTYCIKSAEFNKYRVVDPKKKLMSEYDMSSVMHYSSLQLRINEDMKFDSSYDLSLMDKIYLAKAYPGRISEAQIRREHSEQSDELARMASKHACRPYLNTRYNKSTFYGYVLPDGQNHKFFSNSLDQAYFNILLDENCLM